MSIVVSDLSERLDTLTKLVLAEPVARIGHSRVTVRPLTLRGKAFFQLEYQQGQKVAHRNVARGALLETFEQELDGLFRSVTLCTETETRQYVRKTNGAYKCTAKSGAARAAVTASHNRKKEYILQEGENIPALVDLGVFTPDFKIVKAKYDKYKQINRFIELVDDAFRAYGRDEITILDFGCGKSYLTFVLYYYFAVKRDVLYDEHIDMLVTLHACDVATDYALHYAISRGVEHIFSVPCCQHEVNKTIHKGGDFDILLSHGLFQERFSALLTDAIRAAVLEDEGYDVDVIEFIDFAHSPKNLMLRCHRTTRRGTKKLAESRRLQDQYGFEQTLLSLVENERQ